MHFDLEQTVINFIGKSALFFMSIICVAIWIVLLCMAINWWKYLFFS